VDVRTELRAGLAEPVAQTGPPLVEAVDRLVHRRGVDVDTARQVDEEGRQRSREVEICHGYARTATSTDEMAGR
jgi:hypothetical protein